MSEQFKGQVAIVTGAASGLGLAIAKKLHAEGVRMAMLDLNQDVLQVASQEMGENAAAFQTASLSSLPYSIRAKPSNATQRFGSVRPILSARGCEPPRMILIVCKSWTDAACERLSDNPLSSSIARALFTFILGTSSAG
jgi:NAD(P)-dependent dehydrogenase (short-subunit alcohol dehydrogenase family)